MTPSHRSPASRARAITRSSPDSDSSIERLTFLRLWVSDAERKRFTSSNVSRSSSALSSPFSFGISTDRDTPSGTSTARRTSLASDSCGITSARTKLVISIRSRPVRASMSISRTLSSVAMTSGSFWKPSRGPTSRILTSSTGHQASRVRRRMETVPIIGGTGALGFGLALRWARAGVPIVIGSRKQESADEAAQRIRDQVPDVEVDGAVNHEAAKRGPIVILTVPFRAQSENLTNLREHLRPGQILVDATVPLAAAISGKATRLLGVPQGSAGQQAQEMVPEDVHVVSALHTVSAATLADFDHELDEDIPVAGDKRDHKRQVAELIARIDGLRPINAGLLEAARLIEGLTPLLIGVNARHKTHAGIKFTGLPEPKW